MERIYISATENFINLAYHESIGDTPYTAMYKKPPPREITELINFPDSRDYQFDSLRFYSKVVERIDKRRKKYQIAQQKVIQYQVGEKVLLRNRELPSSMEGITEKLLLLYNGPYVITKDNHNNTYAISDLITKEIKRNLQSIILEKIP